MLNRLIASFIGIYLILTYSSALAQSDRITEPAVMQESFDNLLLLGLAQAGKRMIAVGEQGVILFSDNQGESWQQAQVPSSVLLTAVHFFDNQNGWAVGHDGVVLSTQDAGETWQLQLQAEQINQLKVSALEVLVSQPVPEHVADPEGWLEELEYQLDDARVALEEQASAPLLDVLFIDQHRGFAVGAYGTLLFTSDGGKQWRYAGQRINNPDGLHLNALYLDTHKRLYILGEAGLLLRSQNAGLHWETLESPYGGSLFAAFETDAFYLLGLRGNAFKQLADEQWERVVLPVHATVNAAFVSAESAYLAGQGGLLLRGQKGYFRPLGKQGLRSYADLSVIDQTLLLVGEAGIERVSLTEAVK